VRASDDGRELFFQASTGDVLSVDIQPGQDFTHSAPHVLFTAPGWTRHLFFDTGTSFDASPDGKLFAVRLTATLSAAVLVQNWTSLLK